MPAESFVIRSARPEDLDALLELYRHLHTDDAPPPPREQIEAVWKSILDNPSIRYFVAEIDGRIVSTCNLSVVQNLTRGARPFAVIENVVTHADYRRRGLATALLHYAQRTAWAFGCYKVMLMTGRRDLPTLRFYQHAGFKLGVKAALLATPEDGEGYSAWEW